MNKKLINNALVVISSVGMIAAGISCSQSVGDTSTTTVEEVEEPECVYGGPPSAYEEGPDTVSRGTDEFADSLAQPEKPKRDKPAAAKPVRTKPKPPVPVKYGGPRPKKQ